MPEKRPVHEYHLISRTTGNSLGGFETWLVPANTLAKRAWKLGIFSTAIYSSSATNREGRKALKQVQSLSVGTCGRSRH